MHEHLFTIECYDPKKRLVLGSNAIERAFNCYIRVGQMIIVVGSDKLIQVIIDNALVYSVAGILIESHYPHIF